MSLNTVPTFLGFPWDLYPADLSSISQLSASVIDAAGEKAAMTFAVPKTGNISKIWIKLGVVGTGGPTDLDARIETVSTTDGSPTGTLFATNTNGVINVTATDDNFWKSGTLTAVAAVTLGEPLAVVIVNPGVQSIQIAGNVGINGFRNSSSVWTQLYTTSWSAKTPSEGHGIAIEYDDGSIFFLGAGAPYAEGTLSTFMPAIAVSVGSQAGNKFQVVFSGIIGYIAAAITHSSSRGNVVFRVYRSTDVVNAVCISSEWDRDIQAATTGVRVVRLVVPPFAVTAGEIVYVVVHGAGSAAISLSEFVMKSGFAVANYPGAAAGAVRVTRTGSTGAFTEASAENIAIIGMGYTHLDIGTGPGHAVQHIGVM